MTAEARRALIEDAACRCLARGGIREFTVDKVIAEARVSRGLVVHHFGSMDGLLIAVYARMYDDWLALIDHAPEGTVMLDTIIEGLIGTDLFSRDTSRIWIALWDMIPGHPVLHAEHRRHYERYRAVVTQAVTVVARTNGRTVDAPALAAALICLIDGFGLQRGLEPGLLTESAARQACRHLLEPHVGSW